MPARLHAFVVPALIAIASLAYWIQIAGARRSVVLVPSGILVLIAIFLVIVVGRELRSPSEAPVISMSEVRPPLILLGLCVLYYFASNSVGFHVSNLLFSFSASLLMGVKPGKAAVVALITVAIMYGLSDAMNFNVPRPFWTR